MPFELQKYCRCAFFAIEKSYKKCKLSLLLAQVINPETIDESFLSFVEKDPGVKHA